MMQNLLLVHVLHQYPEALSVSVNSGIPLEVRGDAQLNLRRQSKEITR